MANESAAPPGGVTASRSLYIETFDDGPGGWVSDLRSPLAVWDGVAYCYSPWSVDANHCPPGAGYLHLLMYLHTAAPYVIPELEPDNRFVKQAKSRDLTSARLTIRLRGQIDLQGSQLLLHVQAEGPRSSYPRPNFALTGQPIHVTQDWSEQTILLAPDPVQWTRMGARHDMTDVYDSPAHIADVLADVNVDIIFVLFPLRVVPVGQVDDMHRQRAGRDYHADRRFLPKGLVMFDTVRLDYAD